MSNVFNNVYNDVELKADLHRAFEGLDQILVDHAGPFATNCVIGSKWRQVNDVDEFTKDGIKILRHLIVSEEASARFAARMTRFIGIAVDKRCHDGTTTSMLLFCRLARAAISKMDLEIESSERYYWWNAFLSTLESCLQHIDELKITEEDILARATEFGIETTIEDVRAAIAFHMAMISSKGDEDLASKIAHVIRSSPKKIYGMFKDTPLAVETEEPYILKKQEYDVAVHANIGNIQDYNYRNDTQWLSEDAVIFATGNEIVTNSMESAFLNAFISDNARYRGDLSTFGVDKGWEAYHGGKRNLIILTPMFNDPELITTINLFNMKNPDCRISFFNLQVHGRMRTSLNKTLHYMAGVYLFQDVMTYDATKSLIGLHDTKIRAHLVGHVLTLSNLYEKDGQVFHPLFAEPDLFQPYTDFCRETEELLVFAQENITNPALDPDEVTYLTSLYRALTCQEIYDIEIGGSAHDQYANRTVYEDAIGAALSAVNEGVILGGYGHLAKFMGRLNRFTEDPVYKEFEDALVSIVADTLRATDDGVISQLINDGLTSKWNYLVADSTRFLREEFGQEYIFTETFDKKTMETFLARTAGRPILLQAWSGYHEQFRRFKDILPKLANTTHLADMRVRDGEDVR